MLWLIRFGHIKGYINEKSKVKNELIPLTLNMYAHTDIKGRNKGYYTHVLIVTSPCL